MIKELETRLKETQNQYFGQLQRWMENHSHMGSEDRMSHWKKLHELQQKVIIQTVILREHSFKESKEALEQAFTPRLKEMLNQKMKDNEDG